MFEGAVAGILNRILGKYVQDLDTENLNMGIFSGNVNLTDLKLKPEALYELDLPIDVKIGTIGRISFQIPWTSLYTQPVVINIEDVLVLVGPAISNSHFDPEREKRLMRAAKRKILQDLEEESEILKGPQNFFEHLFTAVVNNLQIYVRNVHVRYEDSISSKDGPLACGLCMQTLSIETTNNKWKPSVTPVNASTVYQMMKIESLSLYWNPTATVLDDAEIANITPIQYYNWKHYMLTGLDKFSMHLEDFEFLLKPVTCKVKVIMSRSAEARVPRLLLDAVLQDSAMQMSRRQYLSVDNLMNSFTRIKLNRKYRHLHPGVPLSSDVRKWWRYAYNVVVEQRVRPYTWTAIQKHRKNYNVYKKIYKSTLKSPNDTELKLDLQQCEDSLPIVSVVIAREHAKFELLSEEPDRIEMVESEQPWWSPSGGSDAGGDMELCVRSERRRGVWSHLSSPERRRVCELIGYAESGQRKDRSKQCIEHKLNLTLANCSLTLMNRNKEILVVTLTQFLASLETRPSAKAYKLSARTERIVIEGISSDGELVPMVTAERGATNVNLIAIDIEKNPVYSEADYALTWIMEPIEVLYVEHAITELINLLQTRTLNPETVLEDISVSTITNAKMMKNVVSNRKQLQLNVDVKAPCVLLPEYGCMHKSGRVLVVDISRITIKSDLQPSKLVLEDATCMELEERLYDRLHAECSFQILFSEWRDRWRELRRHGDSELHLVPRMKATLVFSNSIKKDYKLLPRYKLNISLTSLRLNLSDRIITNLHDFLDNLPLPNPNSIPVSLLDSGDYCEEFEDVEVLEVLLLDKVEPEPGYKELKKLKSRIVAACLRKSRSPQLFDKAQAKDAFLASEPVFISSDHSEEEMELYARNVDLPGFDDNVSPSNTINTLLRFVIGEIVINLARSTEQEDHPYLMMSVTKICLDVALMEYGPALQFSIGEALVTDKQHHTSDGQYLELLTTTGELLNVIYRKVRADCPEFRSHFHSVERALVADAGQIDLVLHADSLNQLKRLPVMLQNRRTITITKSAARYCTFMWEYLTQTDTDPPVPSGATKFSYSVRAACVSAALWAAGGALVEVAARGAAADCVFRADDRAVRRAALAALHVRDLAPATLYPRLVWPEEDKVLEVKWSKRASVREGAADGELKVTLGRIHVTVLGAVIMRLQLFIEPLIPTSAVSFAANMIDKAMEFGQHALRNGNAKLNLVINLHAPVLLIPQKASSPSLLVFNMGDLTIENYFKKCTKLDPASTVQTPVIDNILLKWENITLCRAVMTLAQTLEVQEPILEPASIRCDVKRCTCYRQLATLHPHLLLLEAAGSAERIIINLGQRDLATIAAVFTDNCIFSCIFALGSLVPSSPEEKSQSDATITKLQEFFSQGEPIRKEVVFRFSLEGVDLKLYTDMDEILSSPVRDVNHSLAGLNLGEGTLMVDCYSDGSVEMRASLQSFLMEDIRNDPNVAIKRIFQSQSGCSTSGANIAVSRAPFMELSYRSSKTGHSERAHNVNVRCDRARLNVAVPFLLQLLTTLLDHHTGERTLDGGLVNPGYVGDVNGTKGKRKARAHSSSDSTSGYYSQATSLPEETSSLSISIQFCQPEIMFFTDLTKSEGHALLLRTELIIDYSSHSNIENLVISLAGLQMMSKLQSKLTNLPPQMILKPCDVEFSKSFKNVEEGVKINLSVSDIEVHLAPTTVHTVMDIIDEVANELTMPDEKEPFNFANYNPKTEKEDDLWSPKKLTPLLTMFPCEDCYLSNKCSTVSEQLTVTLPRIRVLFEIERAVRVPVCVVELSAELTVQDLCSTPHGSGSVSILAYTYNDKLQVCEPLIEPSPWTVTIEIVQGKPHPMSSRLETTVQPESDIEGSLASERSKKSRKKMGFESETSAEENESDCETILIRNPYNNGNRNYNMDFNPGPVFLSAVDLEGSDSDYEGRLMDKLTTAVGHLFDDDSSSSELSNDEDSSEHEASEVEQSETEEKPVNSDGERRKIEKTVTLQEPYHEESSSASDPPLVCTYWLVQSLAPLRCTVGGGAVRALAAWTEGVRERGALSAVGRAGGGLTNGVGPGSTVQLRSRTETDLAGHDRIIAIANYDDLSRPSTPGSAADLLEDAIKELKREPTDAEDWDCFEGGFGSSAGEVQDPVCPPPPAVGHTVKMFNETLAIKMQDFDDLLIPCPQRTISKLHVLHPSKNNTRYYIAVERTSTFDGSTIVVRSPLQVRNETSYTLDLFYKKSDLQSIGVPLIGSLANPFEDKLRLAVIAPDDTYNVPLYVAYHCKLYLMPNNFEKYQSTTESIWWVDLAKDAGTPRDLTCSAVQDQDKVFALRVVAEEGIQSHKITRSIPNFLVRVVPPLAIYNRLPYAISVSNTISNTVSNDVFSIVSRVEAGDRAHVYMVKLAEVQTLKVELSYMGMVWSSSDKLTPHLTEKTIHLTSEAESESDSQVDIRMKVERGPTVLIYFYTPYIFVNKTGLPIQIKVSGSERVYSVGSAPLVAGAAAAGRVRLRAQASSWSRRAALLPAAAALLLCRHHERRTSYRLLLQVTLSELCPQLTKIVTILPYFLIYNDTKRHLRYMEENEAADLWFDLAPQQCSPFWPQTDSMMMHCKYRDSGMVSQHFPITKTHFTVLRMDKGSAICVEVAGGLDRPFTITFKQFTNSACVRIDNLCDDLFLKLHQEECGQVALLSPYQSLLYTWDDPAKERILVWNIYNNKGKGFVADLSQHGFGEEKVSFHSVKNSTLTAANSVTSKLSSTLKKLTPKSPEPFSSSTDDSDSCDIPDTYTKTKKMRKDKAIVYWISYMEGHQRVFALAQDERIAYQYKMKINAERSNYEICLSLPSVGLSVCIDTKNTIKELAYISVSDSIPRWEVNVGKKWKQLSPELTSWIEEKFQADQKKCQLKHYIDIDLEKMQMTKPFFSELRRTYSPGVWLQIRKSETCTYYHLKLQSLQIDNQLLDAVFPTVLYPTPLPPDIRSKRPQKPSVEILTLKQYRPNLNQEVYKYFKILVQEYNVNLDRGFVNHVFEILNHWKTEEKPSVRLRADLALVHMPLPVIAMKTQTNAQNNVLYEFVHLSPIKIILSLSSRGFSADAQSSNRKNRPKIFNSDLLEYLFDSWGSSLSDMKDVVIRMSYLEIRNAPIPASSLIDQASRHYMMQLIQQYYVLVLGITVLGNPYSYIGDFTKGLKMYYEPYLGVISSVVNNYAESLFTRPKIETPSRFKPRKKPEEISEDLPSSVVERDRNSPASIALALTGLIARPSYDVCRSAAKLVLSRPCGGGVGGGAGGSGGGAAWRGALAARLCTRTRLPRYCHPTQGILPFSYHSALGLQLLHVTSRDSGDLYIAHAHINHNHLILITTGHVSVVRAGGGGAAWVTEWAARVDDVIPPPLIYEDKLVLNIKQDEEINYFATDEKIIEIPDPDLLLWIKTQVEYALMLAQEDKRLPADGI